MTELSLAEFFDLPDDPDGELIPLSEARAVVEQLVFQLKAKVQTIPYGYERMMRLAKLEDAHRKALALLADAYGVVILK